MILDIDHYKAINDRYGHVAGDRALKEVVQRIRYAVRPYDIIARYGGDAFIVFAPDCDEIRGRTLADRIVTRVNSAPIVGGESRF